MEGWQVSNHPLAAGKQSILSKSTYLAIKNLIDQGWPYPATEIRRVHPRRRCGFEYKQYRRCVLC